MENTGCNTFCIYEKGYATDSAFTDSTCKIAKYIIKLCCLETTALQTVHDASKTQLWCNKSLWATTSVAALQPVAVDRQSLNNGHQIGLSQTRAPAMDGQTRREGGRRDATWSEGWHWNVPRAQTRRYSGPSAQRARQLLASIQKCACPANHFEFEQNISHGHCMSPVEFTNLIFETETNIALFFPRSWGQMLQHHSPGTSNGTCDCYSDDIFTILKLLLSTWIVTVQFLTVSWKQTLSFIIGMC